MKSREDVPQGAGSKSPARLAVAELAKALPVVHTARRAFVRLLPKILFLLAIVGQGVSLLTLAYLVDLSVSLMELWAELARKHLELTV